MIAVHGWIPQKTVTQKTDILVVGYYNENVLPKEKSNKQLLAEKYQKKGIGIRIIKEDQFLEMLWTDIAGNKKKYH